MKFHAKMAVSVYLNTSMILMFVNANLMEVGSVEANIVNLC